MRGEVATEGKEDCFINSHHMVLAPLCQMGCRWNAAHSLRKENIFMDHEICDRLGRHGMRSIHPNVCRASAIPHGVICGAQYKLMQRGSERRGEQRPEQGDNRGNDIGVVSNQLTGNDQGMRRPLRCFWQSPPKETVDPKRQPSAYAGESFREEHRCWHKHLLARKRA